MTKKKKDDEVDENKPVLGTGAYGDVDNPAAGSPIDQTPADPREVEQDDAKDNK